MKETDQVTLFRSNALAQRSASYSKPASFQKHSGWVLVGVVCAFAVFGVAFVITGQYARKERVSGRVVSSKGVSTVLSTRPGVLLAIETDGSQVQAGSIIAKLETKNYSEDGRSIDDQIINSQIAANGFRQRDFEIQRRQSESKVQSLRSQIETQEGELQNLSEAILVAEEQVALAIKTEGDLRRLASEQLVSQLELRKQAQSTIDAKSRVLTLKRDRIRTRKEIQTSQGLINDAVLELQSLHVRADADREEQTGQILRSEDAAEAAIVAPVSGRFYSKGKKAGDSLSPNEVIGAITPNDSVMAVELLVPSKAVGMLGPGDEVRVMVDAFPFERFGYISGNVQTVSASAFSDPTIGPHYLVTVIVLKQSIEAYGQRRALAAGMTVTADIIMERRTFWEWITDPIRASLMRV